MADLTFLAKNRFEEAIAQGDMEEIIYLLRNYPHSLEIELMHKLADFLDPARAPMKSGPKIGKNFERDMEIYNEYIELTEDETLAKERVFGSSRYKKNPLKGDIKNFICEKHGISSRAFDTIASSMKDANVLNDYLLMIEVSTIDFSKEYIMKKYKISEDRFRKIISENK